MSIQFGPSYSVVNGYYPKLYSTIVAQSNVIQGESKEIFVASWVDTTCHKRETE